MLNKSTLKTRKNNASALSTLLLWGLSLVLLSFYALPAHSATSQAGNVVVSQMSFADMRSDGIETIDWRRPKLELRFDLMESEWNDEVELNLSMMPGFKARTDTPIYVQFNTAKPVVLTPKGDAFDARIRLDSRHIRTSENIISITTSDIASNNCIGLQDGAWSVSLDKSFITVRSRTKARAFQIGEVETRMMHPTTAPKTVAIHAIGDDKAQLQMLAAQGTALRMSQIPNFRLTPGPADMEIIMVRRERLARYVSDKNILKETGPKISVHTGRPLRLVLTGDTDTEVMEAAKKFASHRLPATRRHYTTPSEMTSQRSFKLGRPVIEKKQKLSGLGFGLNLRNWSSTPEVLHFDVKDPSTQSGEVVLYFSVSDKISPESRVYAELNGKSIGYTALDDKKKSVTFTIPASLLTGSGNTLKITPDLIASPLINVNSCMAQNSFPGLSLRDKSYIALTPELQSPHSELSRLTSGSDPFSFEKGRYTHVILAHKTNSDLNASLRVLGKLAQAKGTGWTESFVSYEDRNTLRPFKFIVGPKTVAAPFLTQAPKSLEAALRGQKLVQTDDTPAPRAVFAANDMDTTMQLYTAWAAKMTKEAKVNNRGLPQNVNGGIAAIYQADDHLIGVITAASGQSFNTVSSHLLRDNIWHKLSGSVARWNRKSIVMAQTATPLYLAQLAPVKAERAFSLNFDALNFDGARGALGTASNAIGTFGQNASIWGRGAAQHINSWGSNIAEKTRAWTTQREIAKAEKQATREAIARDRAITSPSIAPSAAATAPVMIPPRPITTPPIKTEPAQTIAPTSSAAYSHPTLTAPKAATPAQSWNDKLEQRLSERRNALRQAPQTQPGASLNARMKTFQDRLAPTGTKMKSLVGMDSQAIARPAAWQNSRIGNTGFLLILTVIFMALILVMMKPSAKDTANY